MSLSRELLGPKQGRVEKTAVNPQYEYVVGILEPLDYTRQKQDELIKKTNSDAEMPTDHKNLPLVGGHQREDNLDPDFEENAILDGVDPRAFPKNIGMAFILPESAQELDICATWARYEKNNEGMWERKPNSIVLKSCKLDYKKYNSTKDGISVDLISHKMKNTTKFISIRIVNVTVIQNGQKLSTQTLIFQPQIRVHLKPGDKLLALPEVDFSEHMDPVNKKSANEERNNIFLYNDRSAYGRGFQCGVLWKEIDPENNASNFTKYENPPYGWTDFVAVDQDERTNFTNADIRTELLPVYSISSAANESGIEDLSAKTLSENFSQEFYEKNFLWNIIEKYDAWIKEKRGEIDLTDGFNDLAQENLNECNMAKDRISDGIKILAKNENARLAFCFMNKVMDKQSHWSRQSGLYWRPFQISFILMSLESIVNKTSEFREYFDLLWYPTGGGKTEAYLGLAIFVIAYRRLVDKNKFDGVSVISRYTLRLLTIQQFRRTLKAIMAAELLRAKNWHPADVKDKNIWGLSKFSIGLWVGDSVAPNNIHDLEFYDHNKRQKKIQGALSSLRDPLKSEIRGDPAQVLECPACSTTLAFSPTESSGVSTIFWTVRAGTKPREWGKKYRNYSASTLEVYQLPNNNYYQVKLKVVSDRGISQSDLINVSKDFEIDCRSELVCSNPVLPGYFIKKFGIYGKDADFEIRCPNPKCDLNSLQWNDYVPTKDGFEQKDILESFAQPGSKKTSHGIPIHAFTVDDQVYHKCPSMVLATVDKIARLPFEPKGASLFGNVNRFDEAVGYFRDGIGNEPNTPGIDLLNKFSVNSFAPPELIIQDELHLIEGPLGTMVGVYETAIDILTRRFTDSGFIKAKYVGSTATIREAWSQVASVYGRDLMQFPPNGVSSSDSFFSKFPETHARDNSTAGRLHVGVCTPGTSSQTALKIIWSVLLQTTKDIAARYSEDDLDRFLTTVGYFNSVKELSTAVGLYRQDIPEWIGSHFGPDKRSLGIPVELSSRIGSKSLPGILDRLEKTGEDAVAGVFATSMFGTGVDVNRLNLMIVHGQPKTTSSYIQSTGRVGRSSGGLVIDYFRHTKPRDLDHYEFFTRYHRALQRYVEPITVTPFSLRCLEKTAGPVSVLLLRNSPRINNSNTSSAWSIESRTRKHSLKFNPPSGSREMKNKSSYPEIQEIINEFESRSQSQPGGRKLPEGECKNLVSSEISRWSSIAKSCPDLLYWESTTLFPIQHNVVLGDERHDEKGCSVYEKSPQSLRNVESITRFGI